MTVGIYARVSTALQQNGNQLDSLREFAHKQGWKVTHEYVDVDAMVAAAVQWAERIMRKIDNVFGKD